jgi:hypothetical protein
MVRKAQRYNGTKVQRYKSTKLNNGVRLQASGKGRDRMIA